MLEFAMLIELMFGSAAAIAAEPMSPAEIRATFFNGQPFTAISPSGAKFKMTFTPDGKISRKPLEQAGTKSVGTWKINAKVFSLLGAAWHRTASRLFPAAKTNGPFKRSQRPLQLQWQFGRNNVAFAR
jgi:hypothetical protein